MSALEILRELKSRSTARKLKKSVPVEWGTSSYLLKVGVENLSRRELVSHLEARDLDTSGTRVQMIERLRRSIREEQMHALAYTDSVDAEFKLLADLEERGSCYAVGCNEYGQLGLGDTEPRAIFTIIPQTRGLQICQLAANAHIVFARTDDNAVYVWGGGGNGPTAIVEKQRLKVKGEQETYLKPRMIRDLLGEEIVDIAVGGRHAIASSKGGDCFVWGANECGQLGLGDFEFKHTVVLNNNFQSVTQVAAGAAHSAAMTSDRQLYVWGHAADGRLGLQAKERVGVPDNEKVYFPVPCLVSSIILVRQVACGVEHTLALTDQGVWAWGQGGGGRLGLGDTRDRYEPALIPHSVNKHVKQVACGIWHSAYIVQIPPMMDGGLVYTWGSGYCGQLGLESTYTTLTPQLVPYFPRYHHLVKFIACGSHHNAAILTTGELYTWGSNKNNCLGRDLVNNYTGFTPEPGHCGGFGALVNCIGRGLVRHVACGREFTVVATWPYEGPSVDVAKKLTEEQRFREDELRLRREVEEDAETYSVPPSRLGTAQTTRTSRSADERPPTVQTSRTFQTQHSQALTEGTNDSTTIRSGRTLG